MLIRDPNPKLRIGNSESEILVWGRFDDSDLKILFKDFDSGILIQRL